MHKDFLHRTGLLVGEANLERLAKKKVILLGTGGVGSWCAESLVRSGIRQLTIVDSDRVCVTNINRQLQATTESIGNVKVDELRNRLIKINPDSNILALQKFYCKENWDEFKLDLYDYIVDAIDSLTNKIHLIITSLNTEAVLYSSMGAALKLDPARIKIDSIWKTHGCPLAREIRKALRKNKINKKFQCVYSDEVLRNQKGNFLFKSNGYTDTEYAEFPGNDKNNQKTLINGSIVHITAIFGFMLASLVIQNIIKE